MMVRTVDSSRMVLSASQSPSLSGEMVGFFSAGSTSSTASRLLLFDIQHEPDLAHGGDGAFQQHLDVAKLAVLPGIRPGNIVGDQLGVGFEHGLDDAQLVGAQGGAGFGDFDNGVGEHRRLDFGCAPTELDLGGDAVGGEIALGGGDQLGGDDLAFQVLDGLKRRRLGDGQHPADFAEALLGVDEIGDGVDLGFVLFHPIAAGEAGVEHAVFDVAGHFLRADEHALDFGIVDAGEVGAAAGDDLESGAAEQIDGGVFETAFGNAEFEFHVRLSSVDGVGIVGARLADGPCAVVETPEEAAPIAFVAHAGADRVDFQEHRVAVAIGGNFLDDEAMTGGLALEPKLVAGAAIKGGEAGLHSLAEGLFVHEADHENAAGGGVLNDRGDEAVEFAEVQIHNSP